MLCMSARWTSKLLITEILIGNWLTSISMAWVLLFPVCRLFFNAAEFIRFFSTIIDIFATVRNGGTARGTEMRHFACAGV